jgi:two-component system, OmpR family, copper resistance phosphate regulon response regulator CusR
MSSILIAEDELRIAAFMQKGLQKNGFKTAIASNGEEALLMAQSDEFDLLLLDLGLPIKDGWTVLKNLRSQGKQIPIIIVSALDLTNEVADVDDYITKPFRFQDLLMQVKLHLHSE